jgi:hypothetical protein
LSYYYKQITGTPSSTELSFAPAFMFVLNNENYIIDTAGNIYTEVGGTWTVNTSLGTVTGTPIAQYSLSTNLNKTRLITTSGSNTYLYSFDINGKTLDATISNIIAVDGCLFGSTEYVFGNDIYSAPHLIVGGTYTTIALTAPLPILSGCANSSKMYCCTSYVIYSVTASGAISAVVSSTTPITKIVSCEDIIFSVSSNKIQVIVNSNLQDAGDFDNIDGVITDGTLLYIATDS